MTLKLLEYWASGIAVVASRLKGIQEVAKDRYNILFADPGNDKDLADNISLLLKDLDLVRALGLEGRNSAKLFSWESAVNNTIDICTDK
jgi:glycosyltransferase involved in cell wall biosynthesis